MRLHHPFQTVEKLQFFDKYARRHKWLWAKEF